MGHDHVRLRRTGVRSRYVGLYFWYLRANWLSLMAYRADFVLGNLSGLTYNLAAVGTAWIIFGSVGAVGGWTLDQVLFIYALSILGRSLFHLFGVDIMAVGGMVQSGSLDRLLVRPLNPLFQIVAGYLDNDDWGELIVGLALLFREVAVLGLIRGPAGPLLLVIVVACSGLTYFSVHLAANACSFWLIRTQGIRQLAWDLDSFSRYPTRSTAGRCASSSPGSFHSPLPASTRPNCSSPGRP